MADAIAGGISVETHESLRLTEAHRSTNYLVSVIGRITKDKGFREDWESADYLEALAQDLNESRDAENWQNDIFKLLRIAEIIRINVIGTKLMLTVSELSEALESLRDTGYAKILREGNFVEELADAEIRIKDLSQMIGGDLGLEEIRKIAKNADRPHKHGRVV